MNLKNLTNTLLFTFSIFCACQNTSKSYKANYINSTIKLDGVLNEKAWEEANVGEKFIQYFPNDNAESIYPTTFKIVYDDEMLYIGIEAKSINNNYVISSLKRDFGGTTNDNVSLLFDTFNDGTNAYFFGVTPYGVQREGLVSEGGTAFNNTWDVKWQAQSSINSNSYIVEIAIPFSSIKFPEGSTNWRFRCYRWNLQNNEQTTWTQVPQNQPLSSLAYMGELVFEKPLGKSKTPIALIPYLNTSASKDYTENLNETKLNFGGDAKLAIGNAMNLDVTINPDFSNVEVDDIITNLTRFEIVLPEKRQFFIDNSDLFSNYGSTRDNTPFFSRRIGLAKDKDGNLIENKIIGGVRLSGKLTPTWRLGFVNLQTSADLENEISSYNNSMLTFQKKVFSRSNLGFFIVNKQTFQNQDFTNPNDRFNRVVGVDYDLASTDNVWRGNFYVHKSLQPGDDKGNFSAQSMLFYDTRNWEFITDFVYVDSEYRADLGFVPRTDVFKTGHAITRRFYPKNSIISNHRFFVLALNFWKPTLNYTHTDQLYRFTWSANFKNQSEIEIYFQNNYILLSSDFDPTRSTNAIPLPKDSDYYFNQLTSTFKSNPSNLFTYELKSTIGDFFNGKNFSISTQLGLRFQPKVNLSLALNYDGIRLPKPYADADIFLGTAKTEITFSKNLFWSTLIQYSNKSENLGINSRLQWRFAPLSDLFLVYNDNYYTNPYAPRFKSINLKLTYWLNI